MVEKVAHMGQNLVPLVFRYDRVNHAEEMNNLKTVLSGRRRLWVTLESFVTEGSKEQTDVCRFGPEAKPSI